MEKKHKNIISWILSIWIAFVFVQSLFFKFSSAPETVHIFTTIGTWIGSAFVSNYGGYIVGILELVASILLLIPKTRLFGAIKALVIISGAIFFHLFSPLGIVVQNDSGTLFIMAVTILISSIGLIYLHKNK